MLQKEIKEKLDYIEAELVGGDLSPDMAHVFIKNTIYFTRKLNYCYVGGEWLGNDHRIELEDGIRVCLEHASKMSDLNFQEWQDKEDIIRN